MKPTLKGTGFGWIDVGEERVSNDIFIRLDGEVKKRKKKLSKEVYGTSHTISQAEAEYIYQEGAQGLLIGSGRWDPAFEDEATTSVVVAMGARQ